MSSYNERLRYRNELRAGMLFTDDSKCNVKEGKLDANFRRSREYLEESGRCNLIFLIR